MVCPITQGDHNQQTIVTSVHMHCAQFLQTILHRTDLIIFPVTLQTIIIAPMMSVSGKGDYAAVNKKWLTLWFSVANHVYHTADKFVFTKLLLVLRPFYGALSGTTQYQKKHSPTHLSWSSTFPYQLLPSTMIHSIIPVQFTCLTVFLHNLSPSPLWSTSWSGALHFTLHICFSPNQCCYITTKKQHLLNGPLSGTTRVSQYQKGKTNLDVTEARDSGWQWHQLCHMQVCTSP